MAEDLVLLHCGHQAFHSTPDNGEIEAELYPKLEATFCPTCGEPARRKRTLRTTAPRIRFPEVA